MHDDEPLTISDHAEPADVEELRARLFDFNEHATGFRDGRSLSCFVRDADGRLRAGLDGFTWGGYARIEYLWIDDADRGRGLGGRLLEAAEREAAARGCTSIVLDTHEFQAPAFYTARGYAVVGETVDTPVGSRQLLFQKGLDPDADALPPGASARVAHLRDGHPVLLRPLLASDRDRIVEGVARMSPETRYRRFFSDFEQLPGNVLTHLLDLDHDDRLAWVALDLARPGQPGVGVARYARLPDDPEAAEAAVAVVDEYHHCGAGTLLLEELARSALEHGIRRFVAPVLADNVPVLTLAKSIGATRSFDDSGVVRVEIALPDRQEDVREWAVYRMLRAVVGQGRAEPDEHVRRREPAGD